MRKNISVPIETKIFGKEWGEVLSRVEAGQSEALSCNALCCVGCDRGHAPLQFACCCDPPACVVRALIDANPKALCEKDCQKRKPLHIACEYAASPQVIKLLVEGNPAALIEKDSSGKLPIHHLLESFWKRCVKNLTEQEASERVLQCVDELLKYNPDTVLSEDNDGTCPIEYAIEFEHDHELVYKLQKKAEEIRKVSHEFESLWGNDIYADVKLFELCTLVA